MSRSCRPCKAREVQNAVRRVCSSCMTCPWIRKLRAQKLEGVECVNDGSGGMSILTLGQRIKTPDRRRRQNLNQIAVAEQQ